MICYIVPCKDKENYKKYLGPSLVKSKGNKNLVLVDGEAGICCKYNKVLDNIENQIKDDDIICFLHDDIILHDPLTSAKAELYFKHRPNTALAGVIGTTCYTDKGGWWFCDRKTQSRGYIIQGHPEKESYEMVEKKGMYDDLVSVDGCIMFMSGKIAKWFRFDEDVFKGYHQYDNSACFDLLLKGYDIGTIDITVEHKSVGELTNGWHEEKNKFYNKYSCLNFPITKELIDTYISK